MDFDNLPDNFFLEVFRYLPFKQQCRIAVLSRSFRRTSKIAISQTKSLQLDAIEFDNLSTNSLWKIFDVCRENLQEIHLPPNFIETFAEFSFPRLASILLILDDDHGFDWVDVILANNPAVKDLYLELFENHSNHFVSTGVTFPNLTRLIVLPNDEEDPIVDGNFLRLLTGRCPNLKQLLFNESQLNDEAAFEAFLAHCPTLEKLNIDIALRLNFFEMEFFWRMESLQELFICQVSVYISQRGDDFLVKVSHSFPRLETFRVGGLRMTNRGVGALASLENLAVLSLPSVHTCDLESSLWQFAQKGNLKEARFKCWVTPSTFLTFVSKCPNLETLWLDGILDIETPDTIANLFASLGRWNQKRKLCFGFYDVGRWVWRTYQVEAALKILQDTKELDVKIL